MKGIEQLITWRAGPNRFALPIQDCLEVKTHAKIRKVPQAPEWILGLSNFRGEVVTIIDIPLLMGNPIATDPDHQVLIRLKSDLHHVALSGSTLTDIVPLANSEKPPASMSGKQAALLSAVVPLNGEMLLILDAKKFLGTGALF